MALLKIFLAWAKARYSRASHKVWISLLVAAGTCATYCWVSLSYSWGVWEHSTTHDLEWQRVSEMKISVIRRAQHQEYSSLTGHQNWHLIHCLLNDGCILVP